MKRIVAGVALALGVSSGIQAAPGGTAHQFEFVSIEGDPMPFSRFAGKSVLVVNTASRCGFTGQYAALQQLWQDYRDRGLVVLAVPSNDFGGQEPGSAPEIKEFCTVNYDVDFPMTEKQVVKGDQAHPLYKWARGQVGAIGAPKWNFHKYLIGPQGELVDWFSTHTRPDSAKVIAAIEQSLPKR